MTRPVAFSRSSVSHPLGKCSEDRLDIPVPAKLKERLAVIAAFNNQPTAEWARDVLEKAIEGEWMFMQRRLRRGGVENDGNN